VRTLRRDGNHRWQPRRKCASPQSSLPPSPGHDAGSNPVGKSNQCGHLSFPGHGARPLEGEGRDRPAPNRMKSSSWLSRGRLLAALAGPGGAALWFPRREGRAEVTGGRGEGPRNVFRMA
jgi:hypothetical protein